MRDWTQKIDSTAPSATGVLTAEEDNDRSNEAINAVEAAGITLDPVGGPSTDETMLAQAMSRASSGGHYYEDTGAANAYVIGGPLGFIMPKAYFDGEIIAFYPGATNTTTSTVNANGRGVKAIRSELGAALVGGEIVVGYLVVARYDADAGYFKLMPWANRRNWLVPVVPTAPLTVYVRTDGSDLNDGSANNAAKAFQTIQGAINHLTKTYAPSQHLLTIQIGLSGTYAGASFNAGGGGLNIRVYGNEAATGSYVVDGNTGSSHTSNSALSARGSRELRVAGVKLTGVYGLLAQRGATVIVDGVTEFGAVTGDHCRAETSATIDMQADYTITGSAVSHFYGVSNGVVICNNRTVTVSGAPAFSLATAVATIGGVVTSQSTTFSGAATGARYLASANGVLYTNGGGASYFPGNLAGSTATGGQYV